MHNTSGKRIICESSVRIVSWLKVSWDTGNSCAMTTILLDLSSSLTNVIYFSYRRLLESRKVLDLSLCLLKEPAGTVFLPILPSCLSQLDLPSLRTMVSSESVCEIVWSPVIKTNLILF